MLVYVCVFKRLTRYEVKPNRVQFKTENTLVHSNHIGLNGENNKYEKSNGPSGERNSIAETDCLFLIKMLISICSLGSIMNAVGKKQ